MAGNSTTKRRSDIYRIEDTDEESEPLRKHVKITASRHSEPKRNPTAQRKSAAKCDEHLKNLAAEALRVAVPIKKEFPPQKHEVKADTALKLYKSTKKSLAKATAKEVLKTAESCDPTIQDRLLDTPEVILAQSNAHNIVVHKLVQENQRLKETVTNLTKQNENLEETQVRINRNATNWRNEKEGLKTKITESEKILKAREALVTENAALKDGLAKAKEDAKAKEATANRLQKKMDAMFNVMKEQ